MVTQNMLRAYDGKYNFSEKKKIYYFDSYAKKIPAQIWKFIKTQGIEITFPDDETPVTIHVFKANFCLTLGMRQNNTLLLNFFMVKNNNISNDSDT